MVCYILRCNCLLEEPKQHRIQKNVPFVNRTFKYFLLKIGDKPKATWGHHNHTIRNCRRGSSDENVLFLRLKNPRNALMYLVMMADQRSAKSTHELRAILLTVTVSATLRIIVLLI